MPIAHYDDVSFDVQHRDTLLRVEYDRVMQDVTIEVIAPDHERGEKFFVPVSVVKKLIGEGRDA